MFKRILLGLGGNGFTAAAIQHAVELGRAHQAEIRAVAVTDNRRVESLVHSVEGAQYLVDEYARLQRNGIHLNHSMSQLRTACLAADVPFEVKQETGNPIECMASEARYGDLTVLGVRSIFQHDPASEQPAHILTRLAALGVRPILAVSKEFYPIRRVLLAYSGSLASGKAIKQFVQQRLWPDVTCRLVTFARTQDRARRLMSEMAEYCEVHDLPVERGYLLGSPSKQLLAYADHWQADLIVMGNSHRRPWIPRVFGQTARHVIRRTDRPLYLA